MLDSFCKRDAKEVLITALFIFFKKSDNLEIFIFESSILQFARSLGYKIWSRHLKWI